MKSIQSFNLYIENSIKNNWDCDALTDYKGITLQYHDVARKIEKLHILFEYSGIQKGDKIAISGRNSAHWAVAFFATLTYGAVAVPILHEFNASQIHNIVNHSESKLLFVGDVVVKSINPQEMPALEGIINIPDYSIFVSRSEKLTYAREHLNELFGRRYPKAFRKEHVKYHADSPEELALINYTSGTTGFSKGVMLPYRAIWGNLDFCLQAIGTKIPQRSNMLSILPMAHMYGMAVEFFFAFAHGCHLFFLTRLPSPAIIAQAFSEIKPAIVISVPLIVEKIIRKHVFPKFWQQFTSTSSIPSRLHHHRNISWIESVFCKIKEQMVYGTTSVTSSSASSFSKWRNTKNNRIVFVNQFFYQIIISFLDKVI